MLREVLELGRKGNSSAERGVGANVLGRKKTHNLFLKYALGGLLIAGLMGVCADEPTEQQVDTPAEMIEDEIPNFEEPTASKMAGELTINTKGTDSNETATVNLHFDQMPTPDTISELENLGVEQVQLEKLAPQGTGNVFVEVVIPVENATKIAELDYVSNIDIDTPSNIEESEPEAAPKSEVAGGGVR